LLAPLSEFEAVCFEQKVENIYGHYAIVVVEGCRRMIGDHDLLEGIANFPQSSQFLFTLVFIRDHIRGLDIIALRAFAGDKIYFELLVQRNSGGIPFGNRNNSDGDIEAATAQFVVDLKSLKNGNTIGNTPI
jgi:hypothetical protein